MALKKTTKIVPKADGKLNVLFVGDSQTDYSTSYANLLLGNEVTGKRISKIGAAMSVITEYFKEGYVKGEFDIVSVMGGNNDATTQNFNKSFADIVKTVTADGGKVVIITCPSVKYVNKGTKSNGKPYWPYFAKTKKTSSEYYAYADDIAKWQKSLEDKNVIIVDAHNQLDDSKNFDIDGLHLSANGQKELKKLWLTATKSVSNDTNTTNNANNTNTNTNATNSPNPEQPVVANETPVTETSISDSTTYTEFTNKDFPTDIQTKCTFDVTKNTIYKSESGDSTIVNQTYVISNPAPDSKLIEKLDGTKVELGDLTLVKKEDPFDPEIIKLLTPYSTERLDELDPEYSEADFIGEPDAESLELMNENWEEWENPNYIPSLLGIDGYEVNASGPDSGGGGGSGDSGASSYAETGSTKDVDLNGMFLYMTHNQGSYGASVHYQIALGKLKKYPSSVPPKNLTQNWPSGIKGDKVDSNNRLIAFNGVTKGQVASLHTSDPKKLAIGFLQVWKIRYATVSAGASKRLLAGGENRTGVKYSDLVAAFKKYQTDELPWQRVAEFAQIENAFHTDTAEEKQSGGSWVHNSYKTMFQVNKKYYGSGAKGDLNILQHITRKKSTTTQKGRRNFWDYDIDLLCKYAFPRITSNFKAFKKDCGFNLNEIKKALDGGSAET